MNMMMSEGCIFCKKCSPAGGWMHQIRIYPDYSQNLAERRHNLFTVSPADAAHTGWNCWQALTVSLENTVVASMTFISEYLVLQPL